MLASTGSCLPEEVAAAHLDDYGVAAGQGRCNLPSKHGHWHIPRDDGPANALQPAEEMWLQMHSLLPATGFYSQPLCDGSDLKLASLLPRLNAAT